MKWVKQARARIHKTMPQPALSGSYPAAPDYICVARHSLAKMTAELQSLQLDNRRLTLAMAAAGHDLRQRLHSLLGTIELLTATEDKTRTLELSQRARSLMFRMAGELEQLAFQAEQQYRCALPATGRFAPAALLGQIRSDWECEAVAKGLRFSVDQVDCQVASDPGLLAVILNNVVGNAVGHTDRGEVKLATSIEGPCLLLVVSDTGPGISADAVLRSFTLSSRITGPRKGMGLGLAIARKTAELLGHEFELSTTLNGGTCVRLRIPLAGA